MNSRRLTLVRERQKQKMHRAMMLLFVILILALGIYFTIVEFSLEEIEVKGAVTYTEQEVITAVKSKYYVENTLVMIVLHKLTSERYLPFIDRVDMSFEKPHVLKVKVKEGIRAGVFEYMGKKVYFDSEGMALESRNRLFKGVPVVTGVKFKKMVLGEKIPAEGDYFDIILTITKKIATYQLDISEIHFEKENDIYLVSGNYQIYLGSSQYLGSKMAKISEILKAVSKKYEKGTIDMHLYTDEKDIITFYESD